ISASRITPEISVSAIARASIITVGILFIMDVKKAAIKPIAIVVMNKPWSAVALITVANASVSPLFLNPYTTRYIPFEQNTIALGAPVITVFVSTALLFLAIRIKNIAITPATIETGRLMNSLTKQPTTNNPRTYHDKRNIL